MTAHWLKPEEPVDRDWFAPLEAVSAAAARDPRLPLVNPDHFLYAARIERVGFAALHVYRHIGTRRFINVDDRGEVWRYTGSDNVGCGRYAPHDTLRDALDGADLFRGNLLAGHLRSMAGVVPWRGSSLCEPTDEVDLGDAPDAADLVGLDPADLVDAGFGSASDENVAADGTSDASPAVDDDVGATPETVGV
jgi:hypothetical protein